MGSQEPGGSMRTVRKEMGWKKLWRQRLTLQTVLTYNGSTYDGSSV